MTPSPTTTTPVLQILATQQVEELKQQMCRTLGNLVNTNSRTTYFRDAPLLARYRAELRLDTSCDSVLAPGIGTPEVILARSLGTSHCPHTRIIGHTYHVLEVPVLPVFYGSVKYFPKYVHLKKSPITSMGASIPEMHGPTKCIMFSLRYSHTIDVLDTAQCVVRTITFSIGSAGGLRAYQGWKIENDTELVKTRLSGQVTPIAVAFIKPYYTFLLLHALFAMGERTLDTFNTIFITAFSDLVRLIETRWEDLVRAIETGQIPDLEGLDGLRPHIQAYLRPRPDRAEELRRIGVNMGAVGWLKQIWPNLTLVSGNATGGLSTVLPWVRNYVGPTVSVVQTVTYASSEAGQIGAAYKPESGGDLYKIGSTDNVLEYLDIEQPESAEYITQAWDLEVGKKYEVILTTRSGLWRYRLGDVLEIVGFAPEDGSPLIRFWERRNAVMCVSAEFVSEAELHRAVGSIEDIVGRVMEFSVVIDDRWFPRRYGFLLELKSEPGPHSHAAPCRLQEYLFSTNGTFAQFSSDSEVGVPSVRVLAAGTFSEYRSWRVRVSGGGSGQIKVPTVVYNPEVRDWLVEHVVQELGDGLQK
ncbi:GH3 auxin-responsive promoter-domain-containing protein [Infundibulicybe gibba]|nr:GH3 auxin-responsive promoter-domain-containing protein [Infundibulicybe gibba]